MRVYLNSVYILPMLLCLLGPAVCTPHLFAQRLKPGFDAMEYREMMYVSIRSVKSTPYANDFPMPKTFRMIYQSPNIALDNSWDLWVNDNGQAAISLRGTTAKPESWLENFYAAMVPAKGELNLESGRSFAYNLSDHPRAGVHVGWLIGMAYIAQDLLPRMDSLVAAGTSDFLVVGHSQGGALAFLLTAHLRQLQKTGRFPKDIQIKTYCSAGPKPGNMYFAYSYEAMTQEGWAYNVINAADWVPQLPVSIQLTDDFNETNPFKNAKKVIRKQKLAARTALKHVYRKLDKPTRKAQRNYEKYLGELTAKMVKQHLPNLEVPPFLHSNDYVRAGNQIVLMPDEAYFSLFPESDSAIFVHHFHKAYLYMTEKMIGPEEFIAASPEGNWELVQLNSAQETLDSLYPGRKPVLRFNAGGSELSGYSGCNAFTTSYAWNDFSLRIEPTFAITKKFCPGGGEEKFLNSLRSVSEFSIQENRLQLLSEGSVLMELVRIE